MASEVYEAMCEAVEVKARPFLGICVGMQLMASEGFEHNQTKGLGWINGKVQKITPSDGKLKIPHMELNDSNTVSGHPVLLGVVSGEHAYFVHSYQMQLENEEMLLAHVDYGGSSDNSRTRYDGRATISSEKSAHIGLRMIANFFEMGAQNWQFCMVFFEKLFKINVNLFK